MYVPEFAYPFICHWPVGCFNLLTTVNNAVMKIVVQISVQDPAFNALEYILRCGIAGS